MFLGFILHWKLRTIQLTTQSLSFIGSEALWWCDSSWNFIQCINVCKKFVKDSLRPRPRVSTYFWKQIFSVLAFRPQYFHRFNVFICCCCCCSCCCFLFFEYCLKYSRDQKINDCLHATAIDIIVERSMVVNQHISVKTPLTLQYTLSWMWT